ncbi:hypothetical protein [Paenibacillus hexagrammi]|uniref:DUF5302 domain-containing protein n=1 Tax=Paenibacillus hexagrammi TaxID=2908839 RepID=A0ABY3SQI9_9BACL|nr:hypothetical protein [Paenibacillus sp. YPD9-1]UJF35944.1 hypothetical protein L0M14_13180 [Paenibacillus sp. YPD9-1]
MSDKPLDQQPDQAGPKKVSLAEAMKQKLAQKKAEQAAQKGNQKHTAANGQAVKSQMTKKVNNQRRRTGGS